MKIKKDVDIIYSSDPFYDLFSGGCLDPSDILDDEDDIIKINNAIEVINDYLNFLESKGFIEEY